MEMLKNRKKYLVFLTVFQLMVFSTPYLVKALHHHEVRYVNCPKKGFSLTLPEKVCLICQFEFVSFIHEEHLPYQAYLPKINFEENYEIVWIHKVFTRYFSLRAPPIA